MNIDKWFKITVSLFRPEDFDGKSDGEFIIKRMVSQTIRIKIEDDVNSILESKKMRDIRYPEIAKTVLEISSVLETDNNELLAKIEIFVQSKPEEWENIISYTKKIHPIVVRNSNGHINMEESALWLRKE